MTGLPVVVAEQKDRRESTADAHVRTAVELLGQEVVSADPERSRKIGKMVNFGRAYGAMNHTMTSLYDAITSDTAGPPDDTHLVRAVVAALEREDFAEVERLVTQRLPGDYLLKQEPKPGARRARWLLKVLRQRVELPDVVEKTSAPGVSDATSVVPAAAQRADVVLVAGGDRGMAALYRDVVESFGCEINYAERSIKSSWGAASGACLRAVVVFVTCSSHPLREAAEQAARAAKAPIIYCTNHSQSALRAALQSHI